MVSRLVKVENDPINVIAVQLRSIVLPERIKEQIERVQIAKQEAERTRYEVDRTKQEAFKAAEKARGEAEAKRIEAKGIADKRLIEAKAEAKANKVIAESLTKNLIQLKQIEVQGKFNEALKTNKDAKIFLTPGGTTPNIWLDAKDTQKVTSANR
jgi:regulator of protease activity HflC (stomatin/prohibitin superfamily)